MILDKMAQFNGFHRNLESCHGTKDSDVIFMQLYIVYNLAQYYCTNKMLFPTVQFMCLSPKTTLTI